MRRNSTLISAPVTLRAPLWICETHLQEIDDLETSGEISDAKVRLSEIVNEYLWCNDCKGLHTEWARERTREWAIAHRLGEME
jgi:hypothetical protein